MILVPVCYEKMQQLHARNIKSDFVSCVIHSYSDFPHTCETFSFEMI